MDGKMHLYLLYIYGALVLSLSYVSCTSQQIITVNDHNNISAIAAKNIFKKRYNIVSKIKYDSSYNVGNCIIYTYSSNKLMRPTQLVVEIAMNGLNQVYDIHNRYDVERMVSSNSFRLNNVNEMNKYHKLYFSSYYYKDCQKDERTFKIPIKYNGTYIESKNDLINKIKNACYVQKSTCDSLINILPQIEPVIIRCSDDGCIYDGYFIDIYLLKLYSINMKVYRNGLIVILEESEVLNIEETVGKLQRILIM